MTHTTDHKHFVALRGGCQLQHKVVSTNSEAICGEHLDTRGMGDRTSWLVEVLT